MPTPPPFRAAAIGLAGFLLALAAAHAGARLAGTASGFTLLRLSLCQNCLIGE